MKRSAKDESHGVFEHFLPYGRRKRADHPPAYRNKAKKADNSSFPSTLANELSLEETRLQFLANMNHELRTPLNGLLGASDLMSMTPLSDEQKIYLDIFRKSSRQLLRMVDSILDYGDMFSGQFRLQRAHFDFRQILEDCYFHFLPSAKKKYLDFKLEIDDSVPRWIFADAKRVSQILYSLVCNALKFTDNGSIGIKVRIDESNLEIIVKDTGIGITSDKWEIIFEAFEQRDHTHTRRHGGAGMGLAIARFLARAMGGELSMQSEPNLGTEFALKFPFLQSIEDMEPRSWPQSKCEPKILLVEDNEINQAVLFLLFSKRGIHIDIAQNGLEGLNTHRKNHYDLIFMDMQMPVMDGIDATVEIRAFDKDVQIVALTANILPETRDRAIAAGMNDFLQKPLRPEDLELILEQARNRLRN